MISIGLSFQRPEKRPILRSEFERKAMIPVRSREYLQFSQELMISWQFFNVFFTTGCPNKHGNSVTNSISSFQIILWFSIVIPTEKAVIYKSFVCHILKLGITMLIHNKDDIEFVTEFPCFLGHPVLSLFLRSSGSKPETESQPREMKLENLFHFLSSSFSIDFSYYK